MGAASENSSVASASDTLEEAEAPVPLRLAIVEKAGNWSAVTALPDVVRETARVLASHPRCKRVRGREAGIVLADDQFLRSLNRTYRGKDAPTNVLSFPFRAGPGEYDGGYLGDVALAAETIACEAADHGIPVAHHFQHLVLHGILHLIGFDHETDAQATVMERVEIEVLAGLGIRDPYSGSEPNA
jgi:probable rRNA maturation factor